MNAEQRELYRIALLRVLDANTTTYGLRAAVVAIHAQPFGFKSTPEQAAQELVYLKDKGFADTNLKAISPENQTWRITAAGRDWLATNG